MFYRKAVEDLKNWYKQANRKPLVIRGARQVGKTTAVRLAAQELGVKIIEINLERHSELNIQFQAYKLDEILFSISLITSETINSDSSVILFLDEAQATPAAYSCLRYFYEDMPNLAVILTGSLLDQVLQNYQLSTPVGRIEPYFMGPLLYYWHPPKSEGQAEIDYLYVQGNEIIPVEVKSGTKTSIKSLHSYIIKKQAKRGIRISSNKALVEQLTARQNNIERDFELINLPFYLVNHIERLLG